MTLPVFWISPNPSPRSMAPSIDSYIAGLVALSRFAIRFVSTVWNLKELNINKSPVTNSNKMIMHKIDLNKTFIYKKLIGRI
jgi:hypothetical protein